MSVLYIIDLKNNQEDYAAALEFIKVSEDINNYSIEERIALMNKVAGKISVSVGEIQKNISTRYLESPISLSGRGSIPYESIQNKHLFSKHDVSMRKEKKYHIRIHFSQTNHKEEIDGSELIQLQYLAMLLKRASQLFKHSEIDKLERYLTVFIVPLTRVNYPFSDANGKIDYSTYIYVSRYLRLLSKKYRGVIYGLNEENGNAVVTSLDFKKNKKCKTYFPLILIDEYRYEKIFIFTIDDILEELFALRANRRFRNSRDENPETALNDFIVETDFYRIKDSVGIEKCKSVLTFLKKQKNITLIEFSLFAFLLSEKKNKGDYTIKEECKGKWEVAREISQALRQVAQNSIQHTEGKECFFSFYFHEKRIDENHNVFMRRMSKSYPNTHFDFENIEGALELFVSDLNEKENMIENFVNNLQYEYNEQQKTIRGQNREEMVGHLKLIENKDKIAVRNFFSKYVSGDAKEAWTAFRKGDLVAHIGLSQFAQIVQKCQASFKVLSNKTSELEDEKMFFYHSHINEKEDMCIQTQKLEIQKKQVIPGMQISILIPIYSWESRLPMGAGQLMQCKNHVAENYASFATFLDYIENREIIGLNEKSDRTQYSDLLDHKRKYKMVCKWKEYWIDKFEDIERKIKEGQGKKYIFNYDYSEVAENAYFEDEDRIEVFIKGLISSLDYFSRKEGCFFIALTNLPRDFIKIFRRICVQLSVKTFPSKLQLCLYEKDIKNEKKVIMLGKDFSQAIYNSYVLSREHGIEGFDKMDCEKSFLLKEMLMSDLKQVTLEKEESILGACPFDIILHCSKETGESYFERQLQHMAQGALEEEIIGYKLKNTHMRLGSKVHIESFYEMSFLFYRTTIANRLATNMLRKMQKDNVEINLLKDNIIFYGYASYSKAILTSIIEILKEYRVQNKNERNINKVAFASFQHNLMLESEEIQMYYDIPVKGFPGKINSDNSLELKEKVKVIQIVPISSTLTTFDKMWKKFSNSLTKETKNNACLSKNYTTFWVVDEKGNLQKGEPSAIEERYWERVSKEHVIQTKFLSLKNAGNDTIEYFINSAVPWNDPLECELCYPEYVIEEVPLVETDSTSTVPTQQIRYKGNENLQISVSQEKECEKFEKLKGCVVYDHIWRRQNHYQFYIDTQHYFYNVKEMVREWLENREKRINEENSGPVLNIIFSPEHNTNVGFVQYVNTYYFNGLAEIVSINVDKQFRSNFICEHASLKRIIEELHQDEWDSSSLPVKFYFVDDTVITGDTLEKANGLLHSLVPDNRYPVNLFSKIFVLVDRLSETTKQMYIENPKQNFLSFLHIDVSNVRTHGDSCIGCKLEQDAKKMYKRSATKNMAFYWFQKKNDYRKKAYDNRSEMEKIDKKKSYEMIVFAHVMQNIIVKRGNCYDLGSVYDVMLNMSLWLLHVPDYGSGYGYESLIEGMRNKQGLRTLLKTMCRPFFSYDFKIKRQIYVFLIYLAELILGVKSEDIIPPKEKIKTSITFLLEKERKRKTEILVEYIKKNVEKGELEFLRDVILEGLTDLNSTYLMRLQTMRKIYDYLEDEKKQYEEKHKADFWDKYAVYMHRLVNGSTDESRELWLEYLYMTGMEYKDFGKSYTTNNDCYNPKFLFENITGKRKAEKRDRAFYQFCHNLFLQNTGINFDELEEKTMNLSEANMEEAILLNSCWSKMRCLDSFRNPIEVKSKQNENSISCEVELFELLREDMSKNTVNQWYENLLEGIVKVIDEKYKIDKHNINIAMLTRTKTKNGKKNVNPIQLLDIVKKRINFDKFGISETCYRIKERVTNELEEKGLFDLQNNGYTICWDARVKEYNRPYIIAFFDSPPRNKTNLFERSLASVFLYISISEFSEDNNKLQFVLRLILRDIMMYRNRILRFLKKDFAGEIYANYAHTVGEKNILSHEKAHSHNTTADDKISLEIFRRKAIFEENGDYKVLKRKDAAEWLLLRNYINGQIAKIFNRGFHDDENGENLSLGAPMLYIPKENSESDDIFKQKLDVFLKINLQTSNHIQDERFKLLREVIDIQYDEKLNEALFIQGDRGQYYNLEYFKCIMIDIMFSAIKFESDRQDYLTRIDRFLELKKNLKSMSFEIEEENLEIKQLHERMKKSCCSVQISRKESPIPGVDYLVIRNKVDRLSCGLNNWEKENEIIMHRLNDPLDYADGHMSLLAIKRYVENLDITKNLKCEFCYTIFNEKLEQDGDLYFENRLPVLKKEES